MVDSHVVIREKIVTPFLRIYSFEFIAKEFDKKHGNLPKTNRKIARRTMGAKSLYFLTALYFT